MKNKTIILTHEQIAAKCRRLAWQICEHHYGEKEVILAGIAGNGYQFASKLKALLEEISGPTAILVKITLDKNDPLGSEILSDKGPDTWEDKVVVVVDDVLNSGKTLIYAVHYFLRFRVKKIRTVVLADRSHRNFPVKADFVGMTLATTLQEHIQVEFGEKDQAWLQ